MTAAGAYALRIAESTGDPPYVGTGSAVVTAGTATLHTNEACTTALGDNLDAGALRDGIPVWVKGGAVDNVTVRLTITDPNDARIRVVTQATGAVAIRAVNVVTPTVTVDQAEGFHHVAQFQAAQGCDRLPGLVRRDGTRIGERARGGRSGEAPDLLV